MHSLMTALWTFLNSPLGIALVVSAVVYLLNRLYAKKPLWKRFEGTIIAAIKAAEKGIPDETENKGFLRLDHALKYVLKVHREMTNRAATGKELGDLKEGVQIIHAELEAKGVLSQPEKKAAA